MTFDGEALQAKYIYEKATTHNSTYPKGGVSCSKDSFVVNQTLVFQIKFCGKSPALRVAANRYNQWLTWAFTILQTKTYPDEFRLLV